MPAYEALKLENQLCFPLYAAAKEVVRLYTPHLDKIGLTYTQYIAMMVLWEQRQVVVKELGARLFLDTGTLTPLLRKLEGKGLITVGPAQTDKRSRVATVTEKGLALRAAAAGIPSKIGACVPLDPQQAAQLYRTLYAILEALQKNTAKGDAPDEYI